MTDKKDKKDNNNTYNLPVMIMKAIDKAAFSLKDDANSIKSDIARQGYYAGVESVFTDIINELDTKVSL